MIVIEIIILVLLLSMTALTAASETSVIAVSKIKLKRLASAGSKPAKAILKVLETPERFFGTILVTNNIVNTLIASIATAMFIALTGKEGEGIVIASILATVVIIICEVVAKTSAATNSEKVSLAVIGPVRFLIKVFSPIVKVLAHITNFIMRLIGVQPSGKAALITEEEIRSLIKMGGEEGVIHKEKYNLLSNVFSFSEAVVRSVMRPKSDIVAIDVDSPLDEILGRALESGYSRLPVYKGNPDNIIGIINMKDLLILSANRELVVFQDIVYPAKFVEETRKVAELLKEFQKGHTHLAIVTDHNKKITGVITLEDLLEEIVGEIEDEYDIRAR